MHDRVGVDLGNALLDPLLEFGPGGNTDMSEKYATHLGEEGFHQVEPGPVLRRMDILKSVGTSGQIGPGFLGNMGRMVVQNDPGPGMGRIVGVQVLEKGDEFLASMPLLYPGNDMVGGEIQGGQDRGRSQSDILWSRDTVGCFPGTGGRSEAVSPNAWTPGFSSRLTV